VVGLVGQSDQREALGHAGVDLATRAPRMQPQREGHVLRRRRVLQQVELLEDHAEPLALAPQVGRLQRGQLAVAEMHPSGVRTLQQVDQAQQRRLAGAAPADQAEDLAGAHRQAGLAHGLEAPAVRQREGLGHAIEADQRIAHGRLDQE